ncbi:hypothetical protein KM427_16145 [Nocardioides sp. LMS-CY]|uniref:hypothetical protein n=1 Tax=Nocardioides sp. (strain LMS-CY) TaxID=2840457 RepID=UPI001C000C5D|nr:hypothetical protein [Nocardioides sp. LMS-CY]QWF20508.1 hypothetical protein KM427_16145 [Nocardioides sp. LMS-CY]
MKFVIEANLASKPAWWLLDDDDRVVAWAGRTFVSLAHADQAAHDFRVNADDPDYRIHTKSGGSWRWTAWRSEGDRVAVSGDWFPDKAAARDAARRVQQQACTAIGP